MCISQLTHARQYRNLHEEDIRKAIFVDNFNKVVAHNKLYEEGLVDHSLKINQYSDLSQEEVKNTLNGYKKSKVSASDIEVIEFVPDEEADIPDQFDWRDKGAVTPCLSSDELSKTKGNVDPAGPLVL